MKHILSESEKQGSRGLRGAGVFGLVALSLLGAGLLYPRTGEARAQSDVGEAGFIANCASCHQADGSGIAGTFPPLLGNPAAADAAYVAEVIANGKSGPIEVDGVTYDSVMPPVPALEGAELDAVVAHVVSLAGQTGSGAAESVATPPTAGNPERGRELFLGSDRLGSGAAACAACHTAGAEGNLGGSSLGPDLTTAFDRLGGEAGLTGWLTNPPSPTMTPIFSGRPMDETEIADLVAYLATTTTVDAGSGAVDRLVLAGLAMVAVLFGGMAIAWRGMRQTYAERLRSRR